MKTTEETLRGEATQTRNNSVGWLLNILTRTVNDIMKKRLETLDLAQAQFAILMTLQIEDGISQAAIGKKVVLPGYAMTRNLDALEARGFIVRRPDKTSRRTFRITLTEQGRALAPQLFAIVQEVNGVFLQGLDESETDQLRQLLMKLLMSQTIE